MARSDSREPFPQPSAIDHVDAAARTLVSLVPAFGGPAIRLLDLVLAPPYQRRRANWFNQLAARLDRLEQAVEGLTVESLRDDEDFITAVNSATLIALRNHNEEKLTALQNAVVNVALRTESDPELQSVFLSLVDYLTPSHMRLLRFFQDTRVFPESSRLSPGLTTRDVVLGLFPDMPPAAYDLLCRDLENRGLISLPRPPGLGVTDERTTELGDRFLRFINEQQPA